MTQIRRFNPLRKKLADIRQFCHTTGKKTAPMVQKQGLKFGDRFRGFRLWDEAATTKTLYQQQNNPDHSQSLSASLRPPPLPTPYSLTPPSSFPHGAARPMAGEGPHRRSAKGIVLRGPWGWLGKAAEMPSCGPGGSMGRLIRMERRETHGKNHTREIERHHPTIGGACYNYNWWGWTPSIHRVMIGSTLPNKASDTCAPIRGGRC